jgi:hypothetical protein
LSLIGSNLIKEKKTSALQLKLAQFKIGSKRKAFHGKAKWDEKLTSIRRFKANSIIQIRFIASLPILIGAFVNV